MSDEEVYTMIIEPELAARMRERVREMVLGGELPACGPHVYDIPFGEAEIHLHAGSKYGKTEPRP